MIKEINFSKRAVERISQLLSKKPQGTFFRIAVKGGGCSGFKYDFSFDDKVNNEDIVFDNTVVDKDSLDIINGSVIDFKKEMIGESFVIENPKASSSCGCGLSFSIR